MATVSTGLATSFINFSRPGATGGGATVTDRDGKIKWAGHNLLTNSESFDASAWVKANVTVGANAVTAPNGTTTADTLLETITTGSHQVTQTQTVLSGISYTVAVYVKANGRTRGAVAFIRASGSFDGFAVNFDLTAQTTSVSLNGGGVCTGSGITPLGNGWFLVFGTGVIGSFTDALVVCQAQNDVGSQTYAGDVTKGLYLWGAHLYRSDLGSMQLNPSMPTGMQSYYPTTPRNLVGNTEDFNSWATKSGLAATPVIVNTIVAPNGLQTADKIVENSSASTHYVAQTTASLTASPYVASVYAKAAERSFVSLGFDGLNAWFNLSAGTVGTVESGLTATITATGDGWYRCAVYRTVAVAAAKTFAVYIANANNAVSYTGDGTSGIYLWGAQLSDSASLDTYVPVYGAAVTSAAYYAPRLDFDPVTLAAKGLLVEELRANLATYSDDFSNAAWAKTSGGTGVAPVVTANNSASPDGTSNADLVVFDAGSNGGSDQSLLQGAAFSATAQPYTFSVWLKTSDSSTKTVQLSISGAGASVVTVTGAWQRFNTTWTATAGTWNPRIVVGGGVTSATASLHVYGAQVEAGSFPTSLIPTGASTATRAADVASVSTQAFPFNLSEGSLVWSYTNFGSSNTNGRVVATGVPGSNSYGVFAIVLSATQNQGFIRDISGDAISGLTYTANQTINKGAAGYKVNDFAFTSNGAVALTSSSGVVPSQTTAIHLGRAINSDNAFLNGHIRQITYIPRRLTNAELQQRTQ